MNSFHKQLLFVILGIVIIGVGALGIRAVANRGAAPVAYWKFDEGYASTTYDTSNNSNNGTMYGGVEWKNESECKSGKCLYFDGENDYVDITNISAITALSQGTISAWVKANIGGTIFSLSRSPATADFAYFYITSNSLRWWLRENETELISVGTPAVLDAGKWYFVALTVDSNGNKMYINGVEQTLNYTAGNSATATYFSQLSNDSMDVVNIGLRDLAGTDYDDYMDGDIDELKIYDYARTASQIRADYVSSAGGRGASVSVSDQSAVNNQSEGLVGHWKMDEITWGTSTADVIDSSGNGNHGTAKADADATSTAKYGWAGTFDGTGDYIDIGTGPTTVNTIAFWANPDTTTEHIIDLNGTAYISASSGTLSATGFTAPSIYVNGVLSTTITADTWQHIAITTNTSINATDLDIGRLESTDDFEGQIDDVKIYNIARTASQIRKDYETGPPPVAHWKMDKQDNAYAYDTAGSNNGTLNFDENNATTTKWVAGKYGSALRFDGADDYVTMTDDLSLKFGSGDFTVGLWVKTLQTSSGNGDYPILITKEDEQATRAGWSLFTDSTLGSACGGANKLCFELFISGTSVKASSNTLINDNVWHYIAGIKDNTTLRIYIDGIQKDTTSFTNGSTDKAVALEVGNRNGVATREFDGKIDDVRIYNYARTQKQIMQDMNAGHSAVGSPVGSYVGYWKFDEGYASTSYDMSTFQNNGTLTGGVQWTQSGKLGSAISLDGENDYIEIANSSATEAPAGSDQVSISAWVFMNTIEYTSDLAHIVSYMPTYGLRVGDADKTTDWQGFSMSVRGGGAGTQIQVATESIPEANRWYHVVGTYDGTTLAIYQDGNIINTTTTTAGIETNANNLFIGQYFGGGYNHSGMIDEVKIYPFALTPEEVKQEYDGGASLKLGSLSAPPTGGAGVGTSTDSSSIEYCVPGGTDQCDPPVAHWKFDKQTGQTAYDTAGNNDGTLGTSTAAQGEDPTHRNSGYCKVGNCLEFDGVDDYVDAGTIGALSYFTIEGWFRQDATGNQKWIGIAEASDDSKVTWIGSGNSGAPTEWDAGVNSMSANGMEVTGTDWHHYVLVYNGTNGIAYKDGVSKGSIGNTSVSYTNARVHIGKRAWADSGYFNGLIDDVQIYNYVRTPAQIAWDYNRGAPIGWWKMDEGQDTATTCDATSATVYDYSGNSNNGTLDLEGSPATSTAWTEGKYGCALDFGGSGAYDKVDIGSQVITTDAFSIATWIKPDAWCAASNSSGFIYQGSGSSEYGIALGLHYTGKLYVTVNGGGGNIDKSLGALGVWKHITLIVPDDGNAYAYLDGEILGSVAVTGGEVAEDLHFGYWYKTSTNYRYYNGKMDDIRIYNYALTPTQIRNVFNEGSAVRFGPSSGLP